MTRSRKQRRRRPSQQDLREMGVSPGLMARRYDADGRTRLEQLAPEGEERRMIFWRLTDDTQDSEESNTA